LNDTKGTTYASERQPFVVDWQMSENEIKIKYESPPLQ
jgi:hypothetical protein